MDIKKLAVAETGRLHLRAADDELIYADGKQEKPIVVNVYGPGSKQYARAMAAQNNRMLDKLKKRGKADQTAEQKAQEAAEFLADCTESFENIDYDKLTGRELALAVYSDAGLGFIADQVSAFIGNWANFTKPSTKG